MAFENIRGKSDVAETVRYFVLKECKTMLYEKKCWSHFHFPQYFKKAILKWTWIVR